MGYNVKVIKRITMYYDRMTPIRHPLLFPPPDEEGLKTDHPGRANKREIIENQPKVAPASHNVEMNNCPREMLAVMQSLVLPCCLADMLY